MDNNQFDFNKSYSAKEIAAKFELPVFVERKSWTSGFRYKIIEVGDTLVGEGWRRGKTVPYHKTYTADDKFLICKDQELKFRIVNFHAFFMATMSSGKSTLINALLDKSILPSSNSACTAKSYRISDNNDEKIELFYKDGSKTTTSSVSDADWATMLKKANENPDVKKIKIYTPIKIKRVLNTKKRLILVDTPGTNNSQDEEHRKKRMIFSLRSKKD